MLTIAEIVAAVSGRLVAGNAERVVTGVSTDTRTLVPGDLFVALTGESFDGHDFIEAAVRAGASAVLCAESGARRAAELCAGDSVALVAAADTLHALGDAVAYHRSRFDIPVVAITGSNGKTTTKEMLRAILQERYGAGAVLANVGNLNNLIGLPLTLAQLRETHRAVIVEMGMNAPGEIARLTEIARPTVGLITCVGEAHLGGLGSIEGIARAKGELFEGLDEGATAVVNLDDPHVARLGEACRRPVLTYGDGGRVCVRDVVTEQIDSTSFVLDVDENSLGVELPLGGRHNVHNALGAAALAVALGIDGETIARGLSATEPPPMRMRAEKLENGVVVVNDAYNANPASLRAALATVTAAGSSRRIVVLGEMLELGDDAAAWHREAGLDVARSAPVLLCAMGEHARDVLEGAETGGLDAERTCICPTHDDVVREVTGIWRAGDVVLVKGSRGAKMERVAKGLEEKVATR